jgi:hypothetical protein
MDPANKAELASSPLDKSSNGLRRKNSSSQNDPGVLLAAASS